MAVPLAATTAGARMLRRWASATQPCQLLEIEEGHHRGGQHAKHPPTTPRPLCVYQCTALCQASARLPLSPHFAHVQQLVLQFTLQTTDTKELKGVATTLRDCRPRGQGHCEWGGGCTCTVCSSTWYCWTSREALSLAHAGASSAAASSPKLATTSCGCRGRKAG